MKKIYSFVLAAVAILSAASCQKELANAPAVENGEKFTVVATAAETKTALDGVNTYWTPGDLIALYNESGAEVTFSTDITETAAKAVFTAESEFVPSADGLIAVYPKRTDRGATSYANGVVTGLHIGGAQTAVAGSFDPKFAVAIGTPKSEGSNELVFNNAHSLVKFTVGGETAPSKVTLKNNGQRMIAGTYNVDLNTGAATVTAGAGEITLNGPFEVGKTYYIALTHGICGNGISLYYDGVEMKNTGETITLEADQADPTVGFDAGLSAKKGLKIELVDAQGNVVDKFVRGEDADPFMEEALPENKEASFSRVPNGTGAFAYAVPTPGAANGEKTGDIEGYAAPQPEEPEQPEEPADVWEGENVATSVLPEFMFTDYPQYCAVTELKAYADTEKLYMRLKSKTTAGVGKIRFCTADTNPGTETVWYWEKSFYSTPVYKSSKANVDADFNFSLNYNGTPVELETVIEGEDLYWIMTVPRTAHNHTASAGAVNIGFVTYTPAESENGLMPKVWGEMLKVVLP